MDGHLGRLKKIETFLATVIIGVNQGVVMWGYKVVVPSTMKSVARSYVMV